METIKVIAFSIFLAIVFQRTQSSSNLSLSLTCLFLGIERLASTQYVNLLAAIVITIPDYR